MYKSLKTITHIILSLLSCGLSGQQALLSSNNSYKLECIESGVYKLKYDWIVSNISNNPNPEQWQVWTSGPDQYEIPLSIVGIADGSFDSEDFVLFYLDMDQKLSSPFDHKTYVYLLTGTAGASSVGSKSYEVPDSIIPIYGYDHEEVYDESLFNLLHEDPVNSGSGQQWVGSEISNNKTTDIIKLMKLAIGNHKINSAEVSVVVRSDVSETVLLSVDGFSSQQVVRPVEIGEVEDEFGRIANVKINSHNLTVDGPADFENIYVTFLKNSNQAQAWIDRVSLSMYGPMEFASESKLFFLDYPEANVGFVRTDATPTLWEISMDGAIDQVTYGRSDEYIFFNVSSPATYVLFDHSADLIVPQSVSIAPAQNLKDLDSPDLLIVYHKDFEDEAIRLKNHRQTYSQLKVEAIDAQLIYNEFSSGSKTPEAIRRFAQHLHDQHERFKYLLLIGDGSFDYRHIYTDLPDQNFVPTYETAESLDPLEAFPTDDYYALLDEDDPASLMGDLDIAVGRLPVRNKTEAEAVITKIIHYDTHPSTMGNWRNNIGFFADDEDFNLHIDDADQIAAQTERLHPHYIQRKVYWDAYPQVSTPGGNRYPAANDELNRTIEDEGLLVMNYIGHGGALGWSQERVLNVSDIESWSNFNQLPLIVTATCSFTGFDDPSISSAGELAFLNPVGGAVALYTTVRSVYASKNFSLTNAVYQQLFEQVDGQFLPIGEILRQAKNRVSLSDINSRKFLLIGDPSMTLSYPQIQVITDSINRDTPDGESVDTIGALDRVFVRGSISSDGTAIDHSFNGILSVKVFDKSSEIRTLKNDERSRIKSFSQYNNVIYVGQTEVIDGVFNFEFVVPVDIDYSAGRAKISYYAESVDGVDASGVFDQIVIAGTSNNPIEDLRGPSIVPYLNSKKFRNGDKVDSNPILIVDLSDENGINLSQVAIGHEIVAILDGDTHNTLILNDFFESNSTINATSGIIRYPLRNLAPGEHHIEIRVFDILNNLSIETITFIVDESLDNAITDLSINPNPSYESAEFRLIHSISSVQKASIEIFDLAGKLITIVDVLPPFVDNAMITYWNILSERSIITDGVYLCRAKIEIGNGQIVYSHFEKLVII